MDKIALQEKQAEFNEVARRIKSGKAVLPNNDYALRTRGFAKELLRNNLISTIHDGLVNQAKHYAGNMAKVNQVPKCQYFYETIADDTIRPVTLNLLHWKD